MKDDSKSAPNRTIATLFFMTLLVGACSDSQGRNWLTGEPDAHIYSAPRVVGTPSGATKTQWPNLADVPDQRPVFSKPEEIKSDMTEMKSDLLQADAEKERIRNIQIDGVQTTAP